MITIVINLVLADISISFLWTAAWLALDHYFEKVAFKL